MGLGDWESPELREAAQWLAGAARLEVAADVDEAERRCRAEPPQAILLAAARPGRFSAAAVERLHRAAPLARLAALLGGWCEGELRSGRPWPGVVRLYWHQWPARLPPLIEALADDAPTSWRLPRTATEPERALWAAERPCPSEAGLIAVAAADREAFRSLADALRVAGYRALWAPRDEPPGRLQVAAGLWNAVACERAEGERLGRWIRSLGPVPVIVLLDFFRRSDWRTARRAGAAAGLAKPFALDDLFRLLHELRRPPLAAVR